MKKKKATTTTNEFALISFNLTFKQIRNKRMECPQNENKQTNKII